MKKLNECYVEQSQFMSLSKISNGYDINPEWAVQKWLSEPTTLEFIQLWECLHNTKFKKNKYIDTCCSALSIGSFPNIKELQSRCNIICVFSNKDDLKNVFAHKDLAVDFASWLSPSFRTYCLLRLQDSNIAVKMNFKSEEDYIISSKTWVTGKKVLMDLAITPAQ